MRILYFFPLLFFGISILFSLAFAQTSVSSERFWKSQINTQKQQLIIPEMEELELAPNLRFYYIEDHNLPMIHFQLRLEAGAFQEKIDNVGITHLWAELVKLSGSSNYPQTKLASYLDERATSFHIVANFKRVVIHISAFKNYFLEDMVIILDLLLKPLWDEELLSFVKEKTIVNLKQNRQNPSYIAKEIAKKTLWKNNIRGLVPTEKSLSSISLNDIKLWHNTILHNTHISIAVSGDFDPKNFTNIIREQLTQRSFTSVASNIDDVLHDIQYNKLSLQNLFHFDKSISQTTLLWQGIGVPHSSEDYAALKVFNFLLGGDSFNSYLMQKIRVEKGWTYGVYSTYSTGKFTGTIRLFMQSQNINIPYIIPMVTFILSNPQDFLSDLKIQEAKESILNKFIFLYQNTEQLLKRRLELLDDGLSQNYFNEYLQNIQNVQLKDVLRVAKKYYTPSRFFTVIVGSNDFLTDSLKDQFQTVYSITDLNTE